MTDFPQQGASLLSPAQRSFSYLNWRVTSALVSTLVVVGTFSVFGGVIIWGLTFASPSITMPDWIFSPIFTFAIFGNIAIIGLVAATHGQRVLSRVIQIRRLPAWVVWGLALIAVIFFVTGPLQLFSDVPGQPGYNAFTKEYYFNDHGTAIPTDRAHYLSAVATQTRGFLSFAIAFTCMALLIGGAEVAWRRSIETPRVGEIPTPPPPRPRLSPPAALGISLAAIGLVIGLLSFGRIVTRVDNYLGATPGVTTAGITAHLTKGPWVVFTMCETHATNAPYGCPPLNPGDIIIEGKTSGIALETAPDPSTDHISPGQLPAAGQLSFSVASEGLYSIRLTRDVPKGVFVAESPGTIARSLAGIIALTFVALSVLGFGVVLWVRRVTWRLQDAPRVVVPISATD